MPDSDWEMIQRVRVPPEGGVEIPRWTGESLNVAIPIGTDEAEYVTLMDQTKNYLENLCDVSALKIGSAKPKQGEMGYNPQLYRNDALEVGHAHVNVQYFFNSADKTRVMDIIEQEYQRLSAAQGTPDTKIDTPSPQQGGGRGSQTP